MPLVHGLTRIGRPRTSAAAVGWVLRPCAVTATTYASGRIRRPDTRPDMLGQLPERAHGRVNLFMTDGPGHVLQDKAVESSEHRARECLAGREPQPDQPALWW